MTKRLGSLLLGLVLVGCTLGSSAPPGDRLLLHVVRSAFLGLDSEESAYAVRVDGAGETPANVPPGLGLEPRWSPDGQWIVFVDEEHDHGVLIHLMRSDGSRHIQYQPHAGANSDPAWSPDGTHIVYYAYAEPKQGLQTLSVECLLRGEACRPEPTLLTEGDFPDWSPDGKYIAYGSTSLKGGIFRIAADGTGAPMNLTPNIKYCWRAHWSPDSQRLIFSCSGVIYTVNADGSGLTKLADSGAFPTWSPDGSKIAFLSSRDGLGKCVGGICGSGGIYSNSVFLMNADGSGVTRLSKRDDEEVLWYTWVPPNR